MSKKNKSVDLGIENYMAQVQKNVRPSEDEPIVNNIELSPSETNNMDVDLQNGDLVEPHQEIVEVEEHVVRRGRPKKSKAIVRKNQKLVRFDDTMCAEMAMIRALHKVSMQDIVYIATARFMKKYFPKGKATKEGLDLLSEELKVLYGKED